MRYREADLYASKPTPALYKRHLPRTVLRQSQRTYSGTNAHNRLNHASKVLLCYPFVYIFLTLPTAIIRIGQFAGRPGGLTAAFVAADINLLSGFCNVILYTTTRKGMVPWNEIYAFCGCRRGKSKNSTNGTCSHGSYNNITTIFLQLSRSNCRLHL